MKHLLTFFSALTLCAGCLHAADTVTLWLDDFTDTKGEKPAAGWVQEDGVIHRKEKAGDLISKGEYSNVQVEWEWKIAPGGNSGLKYWVNKFD